MINLIKPESIESISQAAKDLMSHLKANKIQACYGRATASSELYQFEYWIARDLLKGDAAAVDKLKELVSKLSELAHFTLYKISDYSKPDVLIKKLSRDLVSSLENMYVLGEVSQSDIEQVYSNIGKPAPKKYKFFEVKGASKYVYSAISGEIRKESESIKLATISHYKELVARLDPENEAATPKDFLNLASAKLSDLDAIRICLAYKFQPDSFDKIIDDAFESSIAFAAVRIIDHCSASESPEVIIHNIHVGGKGFDVSLSVDGKQLHARAIPVEGCYVRFHYRYIIT